MDIKDNLTNIKWDVTEYINDLNSIEKYNKLLDSVKGKPIHDTYADSIKKWEERIRDIEKTLIPSMEELIFKIKK